MIWSAIVYLLPSPIVSFIETHPEHAFVELLLLLVVLYLLLHKSQKKHEEYKLKLTTKEEEMCIREWNPEPLAPSAILPIEELNQRSTLVVTGPAGRTIPVIKDHKSKYDELKEQPTTEMLNFGTRSFLGLTDDPRVKDRAKQTVEKYGTGSCGPRGFYGTIDVHLKLEDEFSKFMGREKGILYASGYATLTSTINAFCGRDHFIICDEYVNQAIKHGNKLSHSNVSYFKHNDVKDLERILKSIDEDDKKLKRERKLRFVILEGIYQRDGSIVDLPEIVAIREKYKFRILLDESLSAGVLGEHGRGVTEHYGVPVTEVTFQVIDLGYAFCSAAGVCLGDFDVVEYCRINGSGYVFSASPPPYLVQAATTAVTCVASDPSLCKQLRDNTKMLRSLLKPLTKFKVTGYECSPVVHLHLARSFSDRLEEEEALQAIVDKLVKQHDIVVTRTRYTATESNPPPPSIRILVSASHSPSDLERLALALQS